ncbi:hypothetical protein GmHk_17G049179 [Glycine max]|nr:hypothetical protein GmHk_17G049179 [Glycine max]
MTASGALTSHCWCRSRTFVAIAATFRHMATPPNSPPPPPPHESSTPSPSTSKKTRKTTQLKSLATRPVGTERPVVHVDPATWKVDGPHRKKLRTYLGIVACDKVEFDIPETFDLWTKKKVLKIVGGRWRQFKSDLTSKRALTDDKEGEDDQDVLTTAIGRPEHPGHVCAARVNVMIKQYYKPASRSSRTSTSMAPEDLEQLTQKIRDQREECNHRDSHCLLSLRLYEGLTTVYNVPLGNDQVKVNVEESRDADARVPAPTQEVQLVGNALNIFLIWPTHLDKQRVEGPVKPIDRLDPDVDLLYLMTLTIPQIFLKPLHMLETSMRAGNVSVYGFLEPQSIQEPGQSQFQSEDYIKK